MTHPCLVSCAHEIKRDRYGRPTVAGVSMTRASTIAKTLDDGSNLMKWIARTTVVGMSLPSSEDLRELALSHRDDDRELNAVAEKAKERAGGSSAAARGTALHAVLAMVNRGEPIPPELSPATIASVDAYRRRVFDELGLKPVFVERFVADPDLGVAGSFDVVLEDAEGTRYMSDAKTGAKSWERRFCIPVAIQLAAYAGGELYCPEAGFLGSTGASDTMGLLISVPVDKGTCAVDLIDVKLGAELLDLAVSVHRARKLSPTFGEIR